MHNLLRRALAWGILLWGTTPALSQRYRFESYGDGQGLSSPNIQALAKDPQGILWVGTTNGLFRFDGNHSTRFGDTDGLPDNNILSLQFMPDGRLWIGTWKGLGRMERDGRIFRIADPLFQTSIPTRGLAVSKAGSLYVATMKGLAEVTGVSDTGAVQYRLTANPARAGYPFVTSTQALADGGVAYGCGLGVCLARSGSTEFFGKAEGLAAEAKHWYQGLFEDREGTIWARNALGLYRLGRGEKRFQRIPDETVPPVFESYPAIFRVGDGFAVTTHLGLALYREGRFRNIGTPNGLPVAEIAAGLEEEGGVVWLGSVGSGLFRWVGMGAWEGYNRESGLAGDRITAIVRDNKNRLWVGTTTGLSVGELRLGEWQWKKVPVAGASLIRHLVIDARDRLWIVSAQPELRYLDLGTNQVKATAAMEGQLFGAFPDSKNNLWVTATTGAFRIDLQTLKIERQRLAPNVQRDPAATWVMEDGQGTIWIATYKGLFRRDGAGWQRYLTKDGLRSDLIASLASEKDGWIYGSYFDAGPLFRFRFAGGRLQSEAVEIGNMPIQTRAMFRDSRGRFWLFTDHGLRVMDGKKVMVFQEADGVVWQDNVSASFLEEGPGQYWIGATRGLMRFHESGARESHIEPVLSSILVDGKREVVRSPLLFRSMDTQFQLGSIPFRPDAEYRFRIEGPGSPWIAVHDAEFNLPAIGSGRYPLELSARVGGQEWSESKVALELDYQPPWPVSFWVAIGAALALAPCSLFWNRYRVRVRMRESAEQQRKLEEVIELRTRDLEEARKKAEAAMRMKAEFVANMSHEIRTPMNAILGMSQLALETKVGAEQREYLETVASSASSLLTLLNDILDLSKMEAGKLDLFQSEFDLEHCLKGVIETLRVPAERKGLSLMFRIEPSTPQQLVGDEHRLRQILLNLIGNAIKFTASGKIDVTVWEEGRDGAGPQLHFMVADTGMGVPVEFQRVIFEAFTQADGTTTRRFGGTGLGLAICSELVAKMQGRIWVESPWRERMLGVSVEGSAFHFTAKMGLALEASAVVDTPETRAVVVKRVLVAEDNAVNQRLIERMLTRQGHSVRIVADGEQAVEAAAAERFDIILMDVQMPKMDGLEATKKIRERDAVIPIVAVTANAMTGDREKCLAAGMNDYLSKPIQMAELARVLRGRV